MLKDLIYIIDIFAVAGKNALTATKNAIKFSLILILIFCSLTTAAHVHSSVGRALILSPVEDSHPFSEVGDLMSDLTSVGYSVDVMNDSKVTVEFLESGLRDYSVIVFRTESIEFEGEALSFLTGEIVSGETVAKYQQEISDELVAYTSSNVFRVFPSFVEHFYAPNGLQGKLIYFFSAFSSSFSSSFMKAGAKVFIGYAGDVYLEWGIGDRATISLFDFLCRGRDVDTSVRETKQLLNSRWGVSAPFNTISYVGDGAFTITSITSTSTATQTVTTTTTATNATSTSSTTTSTTTTSATTSTVIPEFPQSVASFILLVATATLLFARRHLSPCSEQLDKIG